jgi:rhodanese-related sulfurtransferase
MNTDRLRLPILLLVCVLLFAAKDKTTKYQCLPCGLDCDKTTFTGPGTCPDCHMGLVASSSVNFKRIAPASLCSYLKSHPKTVLLDVRTQEEFEGKADPDFGTLQNAVNIPIQQLENRLPELRSFKNREIIVYCSHSHRSPQAAYLLTQNGFKNVVNLTGGMSVMPDDACKK